MSLFDISYYNFIPFPKGMMSEIKFPLNFVSYAMAQNIFEHFFWIIVWIKLQSLSNINFILSEDCYYIICTLNNTYVYFNNSKNTN